MKENEQGPLAETTLKHCLTQCVRKTKNLDLQRTFGNWDALEHDDPSRSLEALRALLWANVERRRKILNDE